MKKLIIFCLLLAFNVSAAEWETVPIPYAKCGDGMQYKVFVKKGKKSRLAIELMGGGACWDRSTCWGPMLHTWIHPIPELPAFSYLTTDESPIKDYTFVYFPYCTGDVFAADHTANYLPLKNTYHHGRRNINLTLDYLRSSKIIDFKAVKSLVAYGSSAGAIGTLLHSVTFDSYMTPTKKLLIADSPGLHYSRGFWNKFTPELIADFRVTFANAGIKVDRRTGLIAPQLKDYCKDNASWKIGFIQTTRDIIMSSMFGEISQERHRELVLSERGIRNVLKYSRNCSTHISEGQGHMLLILPDVAASSYDMDSGESAKDYVDRLIQEM